MSHVPEPCYISFSLLYSFFPLTACHMFPNLEQECDQLDEWTTVVRKKRWCHKSGNAPDGKFNRVEIFSQDWNQILELFISKNGFGTSSRMQEVCGFKHWEPDMIHMHLSKAKLLDEGDISEVLNSWKWPQKLVLECHKCLLVTRFEPRSWRPNRCLMPPTSSDNEQKWNGC